jgi:hypothetical protein
MPEIPAGGVSNRHNETRAAETPDLMDALRKSIDDVRAERERRARKTHRKAEMTTHELARQLLNDVDLPITSAQDGRSAAVQVIPVLHLTDDPEAFLIHVADV